MSMATIFLAPGMMMAQVYLRETDLDQVRNALPIYTPCAPIEVEDAGEAAAEEMFDLTNNPYRREERVAKYGRGRSLSVGDVVDVDGEKFVCLPMGWAALA